MNTLGHLPIERFVGRLIRAYIDGQGHCAATLVEIKKDRAIVQTVGNKRRYSLPFNSLHPNWSNNQDLLAESIEISKQKNTGGIPVRNAFEQASKPLFPSSSKEPEKPVEPLKKVDQPKEKPPAKKAEKINVPVEIKKDPEPKKIVIGSKIQTVKVGDSKGIGWVKDLQDLQNELDKLSESRIKVDSMRIALEIEERQLVEANTMIELLVEELSKNKVSIIWEEESIINKDQDQNERPTARDMTGVKLGRVGARRNKKEVREVELQMRDFLSKIMIGDRFSVAKMMEDIGLERRSVLGYKIFHNIIDGFGKFTISSHGVSGKFYKRIG